MDDWVSFSFTYPSSLHLKAKFMKKNRLRMIVSMGCKQVPITYESLGLQQRNKNFRTPVEQANKMMLRFLLLRSSFTEKEHSNNLRSFLNNTQICIQCIQCFILQI